MLLFWLDINRFYLYLSGLIHRHITAPVPVKQPRRIWYGSTYADGNDNVVLQNKAQNIHML